MSDIIEIPYNESNMPVPTGHKHYVYEVMNGDDFDDIAEQFDMTPVQLSRFMQERYGSDNIYPGMSLEIPTRLVKEGDKPKIGKMLKPMINEKGAKLAIEITLSNSLSE